MELRVRGFKDEITINRSPDQLNLFSKCVAITNREEWVIGMNRWKQAILRECSAGRTAFPAFNNLKISSNQAEWIRDYFGSALIEIESDTTEDALHQLRMSRWRFGIFYHIACMGNWMEVVDSQLSLLVETGLNGITISILGSDQDRVHVAELATQKGLEVKFGFHHENLALYEIPAMRLIEDWASTHPGDYLMYFHTKGVSSPQSKSKERWRELMEKYVILDWRNNCEKLRRGFDAAGVCWKDMFPISHFSGNFYIARSDFINQLTPFDYYYSHPKHGLEWEHYHRLGPEFWLGSGHPYPNIYSHFVRNERIDHDDFWLSH